MDHDAIACNGLIEAVIIDRSIISDVLALLKSNSKAKPPAMSVDTNSENQSGWEKLLCL